MDSQQRRRWAHSRTSKTVAWQIKSPLSCPRPARLSHRLQRWLTVAVVAMFVVTGCRQPAPPTPPVEELAWTRITLAEGTAPSSLASAGPSLLVGGRSSVDGNHPVLFQRRRHRCRPAGPAATEQPVREGGRPELAGQRRHRRCSRSARRTAARTPTSAGPPGPGRSRPSPSIPRPSRPSAASAPEVCSTSWPPPTGRSSPAVGPPRTGAVSTPRSGWRAARPGSDKSPPAGRWPTAMSFRSRRGRRAPTARP